MPDTRPPSNSGPQCQFLHTGHRYRVTRPFTDFDHRLHPAGEVWSFLGYSFVPYDDGMSFFVSINASPRQQIRLHWSPEEQGPILDNLSTYLEPVPPDK